jgi:Co/Zn/Cd efflux system component
MYSSVFSIFILVVSSFSVGGEAVDRLTHPDADDHVDMSIVLAFALLGIVVDVISLRLFCRNEATVNYSANKSEGQLESGQLNMCTALLHSGGDMLRRCVAVTGGVCHWRSLSLRRENLLYGWAV